MTEQNPSREAAEERANPPERAGRRFGVLLFWLLAIGFVAASTKSLVEQVFGMGVGYVDARSQTCDDVLSEAAHQLREARGAAAHDELEAELPNMLSEMTAACTATDPTVLETTAVIMRMRKRLARNATAITQDRSRLISALERYSRAAAPDQE